MELPVIVIHAGQKAKLSLFDTKGKETVILDIGPAAFKDVACTESNDQSFYVVCNWFISLEEMNSYYSKLFVVKE